MLRTQGIAHFTIPVSDLNHSLNFYREILGLELLSSNRHLAFLRSGKDHVVLALVDDVKPGMFSRQRNFHQAFIVEGRDFESSIDFLKSKGVDVFYQDERGPGSVVAGRSAYFHDPDGNTLEIIDLEAIAFRPTERADRSTARA